MEKFVPSNLDEKWSEINCPEPKNIIFTHLSAISKVLNENQLGGWLKKKEWINPVFREVLLYRNGIFKPSQLITETRKNIISLHPGLQGKEITPNNSDQVWFNLMANYPSGREEDFERLIKNGYRGILRKLWNIARYLKNNFHLHHQEMGKLQPGKLNDLDKWFLHKLNMKLERMEKDMISGKLERVGQGLYKLWTRFYSRWYLELNKSPIKSDPRTINYFFIILLIISCPFMPNITEEIRTRLYPDMTSCLIDETPPVYRGDWIYPQEYERINKILGIIKFIRRFKERFKVSDLSARTIIVVPKSKTEKEYLNKNRGYLEISLPCKKIKVSKKINQKGFRMVWEEFEIGICFNGESDQILHIDRLSLDVQVKKKRVKALQKEIESVEKGKQDPQKKIKLISRLSWNIKCIEELERIKDDLQ